jgi:glutamyl-tRNA reductase
MPLLAVGINHNSAPVGIRERVAFAPEHIVEALRDLTSDRRVREAAILSTCNRTELYCGVNGSRHKDLLQWLSHYHQLSPGQIAPYSYTYPEREMVRHILRVASGLDSMVLGEPQILGQVKAAYQAASKAGTLGQLLGKLFQCSFSVAKKVRTDTAIGASPVSVAFAAVSLARQIFGDLGRHTALLIGAGETIELTTRHLHEQHLGRMILANRTSERAHELAAQFDGFAIALDEVSAHLADADIIISSTASRMPILHRPAVEQAIRKRKHRPMFMVDIAVPRDIDPAVNELDDVYLYTVDDLQEVIQENLGSRQEAAKQAEQIIDVNVERFMGWMRSLQSVETICSYRANAREVCEEVLARALRFLDAGKDPSTVAHYVAHTVTNKLIHTPSVKLKQAGSEGRQDLIQAAQELFDVKVISHREDLDSQ